mmetsp:Transcript_8741/g.9952  ORF Transcript_8741/g.9952 Transcript_8741/m.9952 type:complete len:104 (+) Transcript_8741:2-313(+)
MDELIKYAVKSPTGIKYHLKDNLKPLKIPGKISEATMWESGIDVKQCTVDEFSVEMPSIYNCPDKATLKRHSIYWTKAMYGILNNLKWLLVWVVQGKKEGAIS